MKVLGVIPARIGSTRLPRKPLRMVLGKPLIQYVYENAKRIKVLSDLLVACDSEEVRGAVEAFGGKAVMTKAAHTSGTERLSEVAQRIDADVYVNIQGDEPLTNPADIGRLIESFSSPDVKVGTLCVRSENEDDYKDPNVVKCVADKAGYALYFSRSMIPYFRDGKPGTFLKHLGVYAYRKAVILEVPRLAHSTLEAAEKLEQLRLLENGFRIKVVLAECDSLGIDTEEDMQRFEAQIKSRK
ncbi:MAG: 3-deoxy-manno-octulosonate cytidylyltransferase [Candidatus Omnitrophica bacterium]|nr:3-deoxy-manno-octulosonate cytidylyltransferase [Candidatus Omnitrophota bacterium]